MNDNSGKSLAPALDRGMDILEFMASVPGSQTLTQLARSVGRSVSEIQRMVTCLQQRSYLVRDSLGAFRLSSKLFGLAHQHPPYRDLLSRARPAMEEFVARTGESVLVSILAEDRLLLVGQVEGHGPVRLALEVGLSQDPIHAVSGRVLLSGWASGDLAAWMSRRRFPSAQRAELLARLELVRHRGYDESEGETIEGVHGLAVPVALPGKRIIAALATPWLQRRQKPLKQSMLLRHLRAAATQVAAAYEPSPSSQRPRGRAALAAEPINRR